MGAAPTVLLPTVLMTVDAVGGVWRYALTLSRGLVERGWRVVLAGLGPEPSPAQRAEAERCGVVFHWSAHGLEWMRPAADDLAAGDAWLLALARRHRPAVVHLNGYRHASLAWDAPCVVVAHSCVTSWWQAVHGAPPPAEWDGYRAAVQAALAGPWPVMSPTVAFAAALQALYGPIKSLRVIANGIDVAGPSPRTKQPVAVAAGRAWDEAKNLALLDRAAAEVACPVLIAGSTTAPDGRAHRFDHARSLGFVADMMPVLAEAAVFASPALYEPFGLSVLEAAQAGCALLLGDIPTFRELWDGAARFIDPRDQDGWAAALNALLVDLSACEEMGALARERAVRFDAPSMVDAYAALYADMMTSVAA